MAGRAENRGARQLPRTRGSCIRRTTRSFAMFAATCTLIIHEKCSISSHSLETMDRGLPSACPAPMLRRCIGGGVMRLRGGMYGSESSDPSSDEQDIIAEMEARAAGLQSNHSINR